MNIVINFTDDYNNGFVYEKDKRCFCSLLSNNNCSSISNGINFFYFVMRFLKLTRY